MPACSPFRHNSGNELVVAPWRDQPFQTLQSAGRLLGVSTTTLYKMARTGDLKLKRLVGRTVVETSEVVRLVDAAEDWKPSDRTVKATAARWAPIAPVEA